MDMAKPKIRFKGYQDDWEQRKLGDLVDRVTRKNQDLVSELPLTISAQYGLINQNEFFDKRVASKDVRGYYLIRKGEFAYNKSTSTDAPWGAVKRLESYENGVLSTLYIVFGIKEGAPIDSNFLVWYYNTNLWHKDIHEIAAEGARNHGLLNIAPADFFNTKLKIPQDIEEQEGIGKYFSTLDHLITLHQRKRLGLLKVGKNAWEQRKLKDVIIDAYQGINTTADKVIYSNEGIPVLQAKHITAGSIDFTDVRYLKKEQYNEYFPKYTPQKGDMLFANIGTIGPSTIVENQGEFLIAWNILRIVFNKNLVDAYFVHLIFDKYKDSGYFERMQTGNATKFINKDNIFDINLFMPSEVEQHKIGGYFQKLDHLITLHQQKQN